MITILKSRRGVFSLGMCALLFAVHSLALEAQSSDNSATLSGVVADVSGRPIGNAAVSVRSESSGTTVRRRQTPMAGSPLTGYRKAPTRLRPPRLVFRPVAAAV